MLPVPPFLLKAGELSALHRVRSDEIWHHYAGDALELHAFTETQHTRHRLGRDLSAEERRPHEKIGRPVSRPPDQVSCFAATGRCR